MNDDEYLQMINQNLNAYLANDKTNHDIRLMVDDVVSTIIQLFECDYRKLNEAIEFFLVKKNDSKNFKFSNDYRFDISKSSKLSVKGFLSKDQPILFFYKDDDELPYAIVNSSYSKQKDTYSVEISDNAKFLSTCKRGGKHSESGFAVVNHYEYFEDGLVMKNNSFVRTDSNDAVISFKNIKDLPSDYFCFLNLLSNALRGSGMTDIQFSGSGLDILFLQVFDKMKDMVDEKTIPLIDLLHLLNMVLYDDNSGYEATKSELTKYIESNCCGINDFQKKSVFSVNEEDGIVDYSIVKSDKYLSLDVFSNNQKLKSVLMLLTNNGFSFVVSDHQNNIENKGSSFVLNFSGNKLRLKTISDNKSDVFKDIVVMFENGGVLQMSSEEKQISLQKSNVMLSQESLSFV